jgi:hypothetical protein
MKCTDYSIIIDNTTGMTHLKIDHYTLCNIPEGLVSGLLQRGLMQVTEISRNVRSVARIGRDYFIVMKDGASMF